jgi:hypothetical protein
MRQFTNPFSENFIPAWQNWKEFKKEAFRFEYLSSFSEQGAINYLVEISDGDEEVAIKIINQSIKNQWKDFYSLKAKKMKADGAKQSTNPAATRQSLNDLYNKRFGTGG